MAKGFTQYNRRLGTTATGTQGVQRPRDRSNPPIPGNPKYRASKTGGTPFTSADAMEGRLRVAQDEGRGPGFTSADAMEGRLRLGQPARPTGEGRSTAEIQRDLDDLALYLAGGDDFVVPSVNYGGSGGSSSDGLARAGATNQDAYLRALLAQAPGQYQVLRNLLAEQKAEREAAVRSSARGQRTALAGRYTTAQADIAKAYDDLRADLAANAPRAYANLPRATAPTLAPDVISQYAQAVGVPRQLIAEAVAQEATRAVGTGDAYNRLLANLQANEAAQQASRLTGVDMAQTSARGRLDALQQAGLDRIEEQKRAALNQILAEIQQGQFGIAQGQLGYEQGLRQALAGIYGTGYVPYPGV